MYIAPSIFGGRINGERRILELWFRCPFSGHGRCALSGLSKGQESPKIIGDEYVAKKKKKTNSERSSVCREIFLKFNDIIKLLSLNSINMKSINEEYVFKNLCNYSIKSLELNRLKK